VCESIPEPNLLRQELFVYSVGKAWAGWFIVLFIFFAVGIYGLVTPSEVVASIILIVIAVLTLPRQVIRYAAPSLRKAIFYEDHATLFERRTMRDIAYSQIVDVNVARSMLYGGPRTEIFLSGEVKPVIMVKIPKNKNLEVDLVTWLRRKTGPISERVGRES